MMEFCDGFDRYSDVDTKWSGGHGGTFKPEILSTAGRDGRGACHCQRGYLVWQGAPATKRTLGFAFKSPGGTGAAIAVMGNVQLTFNSDGTFSLIRTSDGTTLGTSTATLPNNTWGYLEYRYTGSGSLAAGECAVRLNGTTIIAISPGVATGPSGTVSFSQASLGSLSGALNSFDAYLDDVVILDSSESYWGDVVVEGHVPNANGYYSQFTPVGDSPNFACVDDATPDGDTTYVASSDLNTRDSYLFPPLRQAAAEVKAVQHTLTAKKTNGNPIGLVPFFRAAGVDYDGSRLAPTTTYAVLLEQQTVNPATGLPWSVSDIVGLEAGFKVTS